MIYLYIHNEVVDELMGPVGIDLSKVSIRSEAGTS